MRRAISAVVLAFLAMGVVAALGLLLTGAHATGSLSSLTAATVTLAAGGSVDVIGGFSEPHPLGVSVRGGIDFMPLGVSLAGALVLGTTLLWHDHALPVRRLVVRMGAAALTFPAVLAVVARAGHGSLPVDLPCAGRGGCARGALRASGRGRLLSGRITVDYHSELWSTVLGGLVWVVLILAICWLFSRRIPTPTGQAWIRSAGSATLAVILWATLAVMAVGLVAAVKGGPKVAGVALLGAPNVVFSAVSVGVGVPWSMSADGTLVGRPLSRFGDRQPDGATGTSLSLFGTSHPSGLMWLLPAIFSAVILLAIGVVAAKRTPFRPGAPGKGFQDRVLRAGRLGLIVGGTLAAMTELAGSSAHVGMSILGHELVGIRLLFAGHTLAALVAGAVAGAVAGFVGEALLDVLVPRRRRAVTPPSMRDVIDQVGHNRDGHGANGRNGPIGRDQPSGGR
ncbi:streptophobe family protein [Actinomadura sp. HBU206391]|uniref:streptophobe family protein n=1 Tax=Actinomadura sp. HBU206391 TaxID=2731692 RepID=UPI00164EFB88|nr:streptophobe family protein [Actinomadura sp. HBU206391]MBC6460172.1 hypothetical protein [Actinomadura sp. HBU206391]